MKLKLISDGTNKGTKLIDEETGEMVHGISKISFKADVNDATTKVNVEFFNIPVDITSKAKIELFECIEPNYDIKRIKTFDRKVKIVSELHKNMALTGYAKISDADTGDIVSAVQKVEWEATPKKIGAKVKKIKFDKKDW